MAKTHDAPPASAPGETPEKGKRKHLTLVIVLGAHKPTMMGRKPVGGRR